LTESTGGGEGERTAVPTIYEVPDVPDSHRWRRPQTGAGYSGRNGNL